MHKCAHKRAGYCTLALAVRVNGSLPSAEVCARCAHYSGPARGLGDGVHTLLTITGVAQVVKLVERVTGAQCRCSERRAALNKRLP